MLPGHLGATEVTVLPDTLGHADFLAVLREANCMLAPRLAEGVGITLLEAMSQGCAVFAFDAPAMNEYIEHNRNGYLLRRWGTSPADRATGRLRRARWLAMTAAARVVRRSPPFFFAVTERQDWDAIGRVDAEQLGTAARQAQADGFQAWQRTIPALARFLLDW